MDCYTNYRDFVARIAFVPKSRFDRNYDVAERWCRSDYIVAARILATVRYYLEACRPAFAEVYIPGSPALGLITRIFSSPSLLMLRLHDGGRVYTVGTTWNRNRDILVMWTV